MMDIRAVREFVEAVDNHLFVLVNTGLGHKALDSIFLGLTSLGAWTIMIIALAFLTKFSKRVFLRHVLVMLVMLAVFAPIRTQVKRRVHRARPEKEFMEPEHRQMPEVRLVGSETPTKQSFPSGHAMLAFYAMTYVALARRECRVWALLLASGIALSRVYVGVHFPLDCLGGAVFGAAGGWAAWHVFLWLSRRLGAHDSPRGDGNVQKPQPTGQPA
jgi:undecaprenyl-diphosphatase